MRQLATLAPGILCIFFAAAIARACSVCQGDPGDPLVQGAQSGVLFMVGVTYVVVLGVLALPVVWTIRARKLRRQQDADAGSQGPPTEQ